MKKILFVSAFVVCAFLSFFSLSFSLDNTMKYNRLCARESNQISSLKVRVTRLEEEKKCFVILREYEGIIGIYDREERNLLGTINVAVQTLPEHDRKCLKEGISVKDSDKFLSLFEDFSE